MEQPVLLKEKILAGYRSEKWFCWNNYVKRSS